MERDAPNRGPLRERSRNDLSRNDLSRFVLTFHKLQFHNASSFLLWRFPGLVGGTGSRGCTGAVRGDKEPHGFSGAEAAV